MKSEYIVLFYFAFTAILGTVFVSKSKTVNELFIAKRGLGVIVLIPLVMSEVAGGSATVGNTAEAMRLGLSAAWSTWGLALGCIAFMFAFTRFYHVLHHAKGLISVPNAYQIIFDDRTKIIMLIMVCVVYSMLFSLQPVATAALLAPMLDVHPYIIIGVSGAVYTGVAVLGGLRGIAGMNVVHALVMFTGMGTLAFMAVSKLGGVETFVRIAPDYAFNILHPSPGVVAVWVVGTALAQLSSALMVNVSLGARDIGTARQGVMGGAALLILFALFPPISGIAASLSFPNIVPQTALYVLADDFGPVMGGVVAMAVVAAIFSTAPALLLVVGVTLTQDFYKGLLRPNASKQELFVFAKISLVVVGLGSCALGAMTQSIFLTTLGAFQIRSIAGLVLLIALIWPRVNADAGFWSISSGGLLAAVWHFLDNPFGMQPLLPSLSLGLAVLVVLTLLSKEKVSSGYTRYQEMARAYEHFKTNGGS